MCRRLWQCHTQNLVKIRVIRLRVWPYAPAKIFLSSFFPGATYMSRTPADYTGTYAIIPSVLTTRKFW